LPELNEAWYFPPMSTLAEIEAAVDRLPQPEQEILLESRSKGKALGPPTAARNKADQVEQLLAEGLTKTQIAKALKIGRASVYRMLEHPST
jgi:DNA invertase Pin-like site-specific DNA recombinase